MWARERASFLFSSHFKLTADLATLAAVVPRSIITDRCRRLIRKTRRWLYDAWAYIDWSLSNVAQHRASEK